MLCCWNALGALCDAILALSAGIIANRAARDAGGSLWRLERLLWHWQHKSRLILIVSQGDAALTEVRLVYQFVNLKQERLIERICVRGCVIICKGMRESGFKHLLLLSAYRQLQTASFVEWGRWLAALVQGQQDSVGRLGMSLLPLWFLSKNMLLVCDFWQREEWEKSHLLGDWDAR